MVYGDNQTKHFYVVTGSAGVAKKALAGTDKFRLNIHEGGNAAGTASNVTATTDIFDKNLIKDVRVSTPKGIATRTWTINIHGNPVANTTYKLYFYIEDLYGFGIQDRWDRVASYKATSTTASDLYKGLAKDIKNKLYGDRYKIGPIADDFEFYVTTSGSDVAVDSSSFDAATATGIKIVEKTVTPTEMDIRVLHNFPHRYDVIISGITDDDNQWISDGSSSTVLYSEPSVAYGHNGVKIYDMEHYFNRNRADLYDITKDFYTSIPNKQYSSLTGDYATVDVHYAYKDSGSFDYASEKDLTIAVPATTATDFTAFAQATANDPGALVKDSGKYYYLPDGHAATETLANTNKVEIPVTEGSAYQIAALFK